MSIKIYNGFVMRWALDEIFSVESNWWALLSTAIRKHADRAVARIHAAHIISLFDSAEEDVGSDLWRFHANAASETFSRWSALHGISAKRDSEMDLDASLTFYPILDEERLPRLLFQHFSDNKEVAKIIKSMPGVEDFHYQDNTDRPKHISVDAWARRRDLWARALGGEFRLTPAQAGFNRVVMGAYGCPLPEARLIARYFNTDDVRAANKATNLILASRPSTDIWDALHYTGTEEFKRRQAEMKKQIIDEGMLKPLPKEWFKKRRDR